MRYMTKCIIEAFLESAFSSQQSAVWNIFAFELIGTVCQEQLKIVLR